MHTDGGPADKRIDTVPGEKALGGPQWRTCMGMRVRQRACVRTWGLTDDQEDGKAKEQHQMGTIYPGVYIWYFLCAVGSVDTQYAVALRM